MKFGDATLGLHYFFNWVSLNIFYLTGKFFVFDVQNARWLIFPNKVLKESTLD